MNDATARNPRDTLQALGLNRLEAEVYLLLLAQRQPVTAYRIGKALGKATANVYKAIESLLLSGAVTVDSGEPRLCRATAPEEFLGQLERHFKRRQRQAAVELAELTPAPGGERIYPLQSAPLVFERAIAMLDRASSIVVVDAFPKTLEQVRPAIQRAIDRGVEVFVQTYTPVEILGAAVTLAHKWETILSFWHSQQLNVIVDGQEALLALLHEDLLGVHQAVWTDSLYISCILHAGLLREHTLHAIYELRQQQAFPASLDALLDRQLFFHNAQVPGQQLLFSRFGVDPQAAER